MFVFGKPKEEKREAEFYLKPCGDHINLMAKIGDNVEDPYIGSLKFDGNDLVIELFQKGAGYKSITMKHRPAEGLYIERWVYND